VGGAQRPIKPTLKVQDKAVLPESPESISNCSWAFLRFLYDGEKFLEIEPVLVARQFMRKMRAFFKIPPLLRLFFEVSQDD
jgi:hypothetical protein